MIIVRLGLGLGLLGLMLLSVPTAEAQSRQFRQMCGNGEYLVGFTGQLVPQWVDTPYERPVLSQLQIVCARRGLLYSLADATPRGTPVGSLNGGSARSVRCTGQRVVNRIFVDQPFIIAPETAAEYNRLEGRTWRYAGELDAGYFSGWPTLLAIAVLDCKSLEPPHRPIDEPRTPMLGEAHGTVGLTQCRCSPTAQRELCDRRNCAVIRQCSANGAVAVGITGLADVYVRELDLVCAPGPTQPVGASTDAGTLQRGRRGVPRR